MRVLVCPHSLSLGGSQINAIDLAAAVRDRGHDVHVVSTPGPLEERIAEKGLPFTAIQPARRPSSRISSDIRSLVREHDIDVVHTYEYWIEAYFGAQVASRVPVVASVMQMWMPKLPDSLPLITGTPALREQMAATRKGPVWCVEPPIDVVADHPDAVDETEFVAQHGLDDETVDVVMVTRLDRDLKLEGVQRVVKAVELLARRSVTPVRLVLVGSGHGEDSVREEAERINASIGRDVVVFVGPMVDPRPAYKVADVVVGQGSTVLRGMSFAKPSVVVGQLGFAEVVAPESTDRFLTDGFHGLGDGSVRGVELTEALRGLWRGVAPVDSDDPGVQRLADLLEPLIASAPRRRTLGEYGQRLVHERFSLTAAAEVLETHYRSAVDGRVAGASARLEAVDTLAWVVGSKAKMRMLRAYRRLGSDSRSTASAA